MAFYQSRYDTARVFTMPEMVASCYPTGRPVRLACLGKAGPSWERDLRPVEAVHLGVLVEPLIAGSELCLGMSSGEQVCFGQIRDVAILTGCASARVLTESGVWEVRLFNLPEEPACRNKPGR